MLSTGSPSLNTTIFLYTTFSWNQLLIKSSPCCNYNFNKWLSSLLFSNSLLSWLGYCKSIQFNFIKTYLSYFNLSPSKIELNKLLFMTTNSQVVVVRKENIFFELSYHSLLPNTYPNYKRIEIGKLIEYVTHTLVKVTHFLELSYLSIRSCEKKLSCLWIRENNANILLAPVFIQLLI